MVDTDDNYDDGFDDYVPKTHDPGPWMLIGVCIYSIFCVLILPVLVILGKRREQRLLDRKKKKCDGQLSQVDTPRSFDSGNTVDGIDLELDDYASQVTTADLLGVGSSTPNKKRKAPKSLSRPPQEVRILECKSRMFIYFELSRLTDRVLTPHVILLPLFNERTEEEN